MYNVCVHICVCICRYVCATLVCEARVKVKSQASSSTFFEAELFVVFLQHMVDWLAKRFWGLSVSLSLISLEHWDWRRELHLSQGAEDLNQVFIHTCVAHVLLTEPSIVPAQKRVSFKTEGRRQILWRPIIETKGNQWQENDWGICLVVGEVARTEPIPCWRPKSGDIFPRPWQFLVLGLEARLFKSEET